MGKTADWVKARAKIKREFEAMGITRCEQCNSGMFLSFAHRYKRRFITTEDELRTVALLCTPCHTVIEHSGHEQMFDAINAIINRRNHAEI
jgi:hypothetical protein